MPIPAGQACGNCAFIDFAGVVAFYGRQVTVDGVQIGYCRVAQPVAAVPQASQAASYPTGRKDYVLGVEWPEVKANDWCGDWSDKVKPFAQTLPAAEPPPPEPEPAP
jgi:hypothetical protein